MVMKEVKGEEKKVSGCLSKKLNNYVRRLFL